MSEMSEKFVVETTNTTSWNIAVPKECIGKIKGELNLKMFASYIANFMFASNWRKPGRDMPLSVEVKAYMPIPKGKPQYFRTAARRGLMPEITVDKWALMDEVVLPILKRNSIINNRNQIHSISIESTYSVRPRLMVKVTAYYQNYGDIKKVTRELIANEKEQKESEKPSQDNDGQQGNSKA